MIRLVALLGAACSARSDLPAREVPRPLPDGGLTYVIDSIEVARSASEASAHGLDIDGDLRPDNALGQNLSLVANALEVDLNTPIAEALARGELLHLLLFAEVPTDEVFDVGRMFLGADTDGDPSNNFSAGAELAVRGDSSVDDAAFGLVSPSRIELFDGALTVENVLFAPVRIRLTNAGMAGTFDADGRFSGRLGGGIGLADLERLRRELASGVAAEANEMCSPEADPCCPAGSRGETYILVFDADHSCELGVAEILDNDLFQTLTAPDVDLDGDGTDDAQSVAFRITAVPATFAIPPR